MMECINIALPFFKVCCVLAHASPVVGKPLTHPVVVSLPCIVQAHEVVQPAMGILEPACSSCALPRN